jgi:hypothetical protein
MALRKLISRMVLPNFEHDLSRSVSAEISIVANMVDNMLAPQAFAYESTGSNKTSGAFQGSASVSSRQSSSETMMMKNIYPIQQEGLFQDKVSSFHGRKI